MNTKTARMLRKVAGGNRQAYQALKREWATLTSAERTLRRRGFRRPPAEASESAKAGQK